LRNVLRHPGNTWTCVSSEPQGGARGHLGVLVNHKMGINCGTDFARRD
jgi:hypothetical protein